ncbi:glycoside hydrolase family 88 protein [Autumnicola psychrophila]|uniref:Glycoside hydrolase family 88 protein n=1 Tax=Autumnicola psychrophila TaxID=3075592 RepID=A0ABU3DVL3_9FLAO|nr:glycoside hydrolase family 88 protein [Zunongwangia sp. F225]MDT0687746.1 glycoside hydrolase family 88 protein [Zunongwangia sp. F225]
MIKNGPKSGVFRSVKFSVLMLAIFFTSCATQKDIPENKIDRTLELAAQQYKYMADQLPKDGRFPKTFYAKEDRFETSGSNWWVSGFYPGTLLYLYEETGDPELMEEAERILKDLEKEQYNTSTHDLGFMMFDSFGAANRLDPREEYDEILMNSAKSLATRFDEEVGAIRSWDSDDDSFLVIVDNMMNLELLFWASEYSGDNIYRDIAITHSNTTIQHHFRPDNSSYHVINYNENTGEVKEKRTAQGNADESAWARGQAWGLYGFTEVYRKTKDQKYLDQAVKIADFMLDHPNMPADKIPYWDYNAPKIPDAFRDSSAGAIMAAALLELSEYVNKNRQKKYFNAAETALNTLMSPEYLAEEGTNGGFILKHGVGHLPQNSEVDVPLTYGDYYFVEALNRYKEE